MNYYNEIDPYCVQWLKNLIVANLIPDGFVDSRPIQQVQPEELKGFTQCHFFAGIAGWALALKLAEWPENRQVWTGSCPCQPFSVAGKRKKEEDERHLWPEFYRLIAQSRPSVVFGEQVAAATDWLTGVRSDLEAVDYAFGATPIEAACAGAAQYRDRIWFVASSNDAQRRSEEPGRDDAGKATAGWVQSDRDASERGTSDMACGASARRVPSTHAGVRGREKGAGPWDVESERLRGEFQSMALEQSFAEREPQHWFQPQSRQDARKLGSGVGPRCDEDGELASEHIPRLEECQSIASDIRQERTPSERSATGSVVRDPSVEWGEGWTESEFRSRGFTAAVASLPDGTQFIECPDGKWRRLPPPRVRWLGNGIPARVAKLRAFGNGIYPPAAAEFIGAYMDSEGFLDLL